MNTLKKWGWRVALTSCVLALAACGGSGDRPAPVSKVYVMGDSLADAGTFGATRFTVTDVESPKAANIYPQQVAAQVGLDGAAHCSYYMSDGTSFGAKLNTGCTNYAIGGAQVIFPSQAADPRHISSQLSTRASAGLYAPTDLVLIDGGGNDLAELVDVFIDEGPSSARMKGILDRLPAPKGSLMVPAIGVPERNYMNRLAAEFYKSIKLHVLDKGAKRVVVLNIPDITLTPRFSLKLASLSADKRAELGNLPKEWAQAFNHGLSALLEQHPEVALVDFYGELTAVVNAPSKPHGLNNTTDPVCTADAPLGKFPCLSNTLDAGKTAGWWKSHLFADNFHPTPAGHQVITDAILAAMKAKGWL